jgi:hypothetical protein
MCPISRERFIAFAFSRNDMYVGGSFAQTKDGGVIKATQAQLPLCLTCGHA